MNMKKIQEMSKDEITQTSKDIKKKLKSEERNLQKQIFQI